MAQLRALHSRIEIDCTGRGSDRWWWRTPRLRLIRCTITRYYESVIATPIHTVYS